MKVKPAKTSFSLLLQEEQGHLFLFYLEFWTIDADFSPVLMTTTKFLEKNVSIPLRLFLS